MQKSQMLSFSVLVLHSVSEHVVAMPGVTDEHCVMQSMPVKDQIEAWNLDDTATLVKAAKESGLAAAIAHAKDAEPLSLDLDADDDPSAVSLLAVSDSGPEHAADVTQASSDATLPSMTSGRVGGTPESSSSSEITALIESSSGDALAVDSNVMSGSSALTASSPDPLAQPAVSNASSGPPSLEQLSFVKSSAFDMERSEDPPNAISVSPPVHAAANETWSSLLSQEAVTPLGSHAEVNEFSSHDSLAAASNSLSGSSVPTASSHDAFVQPAASHASSDSQSLGQTSSVETDTLDIAHIEKSSNTSSVLPPVNVVNDTWSSLQSQGEMMSLVPQSALNESPSLDELATVSNSLSGSRAGAGDMEHSEDSWSDTSALPSVHAVNGTWASLFVMSQVALPAAGRELLFALAILGVGGSLALLVICSLEDRAPTATSGRDPWHRTSHSRKSSRSQGRSLSSHTPTRAPSGIQQDDVVPTFNAMRGSQALLAHTHATTGVGAGTLSSSEDALFRADRGSGRSLGAGNAKPRSRSLLPSAGSAAVVHEE
jgi:hypothetical protein